MMAFNPAMSFNPLMAAQQKPQTSQEAESTKSDDTTTTTTTTTNTPTDNGHPTVPSMEQLRGLLPPNPLFGQYQFTQAAMAQALAIQAQAAHAAAAAQAGGGFPVMFPPGIPADFNPEMLSMGGAPGPFPVMMMDNAPHLFHPYALDGMKKRNATREATAPLKTWLCTHRKNPYPSKGDKVLLAMQTRMTLTQVSTWFANARRRLKKENKMTWSPQNRRCDNDDDDNQEDDDFDSDVLNRPSSSTSIGSDHKDESLLGKRPNLGSPTSSGGSSEDFTPKKAHLWQNENDTTSTAAEPPAAKKSKIWSIADVASKDSDNTKKDSPSYEENTASRMFSETMNSQRKIQENLMALLQANPQFLAQMRENQTMMNPFPFLMSKMQQAPPTGTPPNQNQTPNSQQALSCQNSSGESESGATPVTSPKIMPTISPIPPRTATPAY